MKQKLSARQVYILHLVARNPETSIDEWMRRLEVSRRTIHRDLKGIADYVTQFGLELDATSGIIRLLGKETDVQRAVIQSGKLPMTYSLTPKNRVIYVTLELLFSEGTLKLSYLSKKLNVTIASISNDLDSVSGWLKERKLMLIRKRGYGIELCGKETDRLEAIAEIIHQQFSIYQFMSILNGQSNDESEERSLDIWFINWFGIERLNLVRTALAEELAGLNPPLDEAAFYAFMLHVLLTCMRIESNVEINDMEEITGVSLELAVCTRILQRLVPSKETFRLESKYLAKHLRGAKVQMTEDTRILPLNITTMDLAFQLVQELTQILQFPLTKDRELLFGLAQHLEPAIYRMRNDLMIRNPLLDEIKNRYHSLYQAVWTAGQKVFEPYQLNVPPAEIGYLTMHLGAALERFKSEHVFRAKIVCPNGISSAELLASRIRNQFPQVKVVSVGAVHEIDDSECDFIVSTVPMKMGIRPAITVSPFLNDDDILHVKSVIQMLLQAYNPLVHHYSNFKNSNLNSAGQLAQDLADRIQVHRANPGNVKELIDCVAKLVVKEGDATDENSVARAIEDREALGGIVLPGKRLAVLHARSKEILRCHISIFRLDSPILMNSVGHGNEEIQTALVLLAPKSEDAAIIQLLGRVSSSLVIDESVHEILQSASQNEVRLCLLEVMNQMRE